MGDERLAAICQMIRNETLEPALREAENLKSIAEREAVKIRAEAKQHAERLLHEARKTMEEEREAFTVSLEQAGKKSVELIKQKVERSLFNPALEQLLDREFSDEKKTATILDLVIENLKSQGIDSDISVSVGSKLSKEAIVKQLAKSTIKSLPADGLQISGHPYGLVVKVADKHLCIEITPESIQELMATFLRGDFRKFLFQE